MNERPVTITQLTKEPAKGTHWMVQSFKYSLTYQGVAMSFWGARFASWRARKKLLKDIDIVKDILDG